LPKVFLKNTRQAIPDNSGNILSENSDIPNIDDKILETYRKSMGALCSYFKGEAKSPKEPSATFLAKLRLSKNKDLLAKYTMKSNEIGIAKATIFIVGSHLLAV